MLLLDEPDSTLATDRDGIVRPNLIVVVFDTLRHDAVFGDLAQTPNLRRFAEQSVVFDNAWGEGLPTIPFRRALFTGMRSFPWQDTGPQRGVFPHLLGWQAIPDSQTTVAEYLYAHGYATQLISDVWHMFKPTMNFTRGFVAWDAVRGQEGDTHRLAAPSLGPADAIDPSRVGPAGYLYQVKDRRGDDDYFVAKVFDRAAEFVRDMGSEGPYCLWVESFSPHEFWDPPLRYADSYAPATGAAEHIVPSTLNNTDPTPAQIERVRALYRGYTTFCDERFGRFLDTLERSGALANSVVAVLSDHGTELWDNGQFGKSAERPYRYNTQINLMIRLPDGANAGRHVNAFVQNPDIAPTLLGLLDVPHARLDGDSLVPVMSGATDDPVASRDHVVIGWGEYASIRDDDWNLMLNTLDPTADQRLFDLKAEPYEQTNVRADHPEHAHRLIKHLERILGAPLPAIYQHHPSAGPEATPGGLRDIRARPTQPGETWSGSNLV